MSGKKISFGFKVKKPPMLLTNTYKEKDEENDIELIQWLEGKTIKVLNEKEKEKPLVIPMMNSQKTSAALASLLVQQNVINGEEQNESEQNIGKKTSKKSVESSAPATIEQRVIKELLDEAKNSTENTTDVTDEKLTLPIATDKLVIDGAKQSSVDDYERIPISQYGMAMLRGMGLNDDEIISKQNKDPELRPKGMGLGADKIIKKPKLLVEPAANEVLAIKKNAYVRILAGKYKDLYGHIEGLDDHACRVIVKLAIGGGKEALNEFMVQPVSKQEYSQYGKVINVAKYEEYKKKQDENLIKPVKEIKQEKMSDPESSPSNRKPRSRSREHERERSVSRRSKSIDRKNEKSKPNIVKPKSYRKRLSSSESSTTSSSDSDDSRDYKRSKHKSKHSKRKHKKESSRYSRDSERRSKKKKSKKSRSRKRR